MRIAKLDLLAYGPFRGLELDLSAPGVHVVFGRNEAGKSTTLRAITGLLYGIDARTRDAHVHKPADLRIGGTLVSESGESVRVVRRKGNTKTLLDDRGQALDDAVVLRLLRGVGEETFRHAFGLDHETLRKGAQALLDGKGDLGESLFDASVGGGGEVQRLLAHLVDEADGIWRPRGSSLPLNDALKSFAEAQKAVREKQSLPEAHVAQERELEQTQAARAEKLREKAEAARRRAQIDRARRRVPLEKKRATLAADLAALADLRGHAPAIASLAARIAEHERALETKRKLVADRVRLDARCEEAARHAGTTARATPDALRVDGPREARIQRFVAERASLEGRIAKQREEIDRAERTIERLRAEAATLGDAPDASALVRALERARALGDLETRLAADRMRVATKRKDLDTKAASLGGHALTLDALVVAKVPSAGEVEAIAKRADAIDRALARIEERLADHDREAAAIDGQIAEQSGELAPPDPAALRAARTARDEAWTRVRAERDPAKRAPLEAAFERALRDADTIADRMLAEADRVTMLARLRARRDHVAAQRARTEAEATEQRAARTKVEEELRAAFAAAGVTATSPEAMRSWLEKHARIVEARSAIVEQESTLAEGEAAIAEAKRELAAALGADASASRLGDLVADATARIASAEDARRAAAENAKARARADEDVASRRSVLARDEAALAEVRAKLADLVAPLGLSDDASADEVTRSLEATRELFAAVDARAKSDAALSACESEIAAFAADVTALVADVAPDLAAMPALDAARALAERRDRAAAIERALADVDAQLGDLDGETIPDDVAALAADADAAARAIDDLDAALDVIDRELTSLTHRIGGIEHGIAAMRGDSNAADAAAQAQEALARVRTNVERWARAKLAAVLLAREIERYREENQGPMLARASSLFARLTLNAYTGLKAGFDDRDRPALRLCRAGGAEVDVTALSEGTRDQLYLALRLASLLRYADIAEPMPLVLDDVLVHFDDERSAAALGVLAEVARKVQVLFFTHHARLVDLARNAVPSGELVVHELASRSPGALAEASP